MGRNGIEGANQSRSGWIREARENFYKVPKKLKKSARNREKKMVGKGNLSEDLDVQPSLDDPYIIARDPITGKIIGGTIYFSESTD